MPIHYPAPYERVIPLLVECVPTDTYTPDLSVFYCVVETNCLWRWVETDHYRFQFDKGDYFQMAKGTKFGDFEFVRTPMSKDEKKAFVAWKSTAAECIERLFELVRQRYKFSLTHDYENDSFIATLTCNDPSSKNSKLILSCRAGSIEQAYRLLMYKHEVMLETDWASAHAEQDGFDFA